MWLGYPGTSGAPYMDYIVTDKTTSPLDCADQYSEKLGYMPNTFFVGDHKQMFPHLMQSLRTVPTEVVVSENGQANAIHQPHAISRLLNGETHPSLLNKVPALVEAKKEEYAGCKDSGERIPSMTPVINRSQYGLPENAFVYCNFNQLYKIDPKTLKVWANIIKKVPNSVLWLLRFPAVGEANIKAEMASEGVPESRVIFSPVAPKEEHVRRGQLADVCLDTPLCNGHTTCMDVLWAGCPVITLPLDTLASRVAASQLTALGCPELIADSRSNYEEIAVKLGLDKAYYEKLRTKVWKNRFTSPLFNTRQYTHCQGNLFFKMWKRREQNLDPDHITE